MGVFDRCCPGKPACDACGHPKAKPEDDCLECVVGRAQAAKRAKKTKDAAKREKERRAGKKHTPEQLEVLDEAVNKLMTYNAKAKDTIPREEHAKSDKLNEHTNEEVVMKLASMKLGAVLGSWGSRLDQASRNQAALNECVDEWYIQYVESKDGGGLEGGGGKGSGGKGAGKVGRRSASKGKVHKKKGGKKLHRAQTVIDDPEMKIARRMVNKRSLSENSRRKKWQQKDWTNAKVLAKLQSRNTEEDDAQASGDGAGGGGADGAEAGAEAEAQDAGTPLPMSESVRRSKEMMAKMYEAVGQDGEQVTGHHKPVEFGHPDTSSVEETSGVHHDPPGDVAGWKKSRVEGTATPFTEAQVRVVEVRPGTDPPPGSGPPAGSGPLPGSSPPQSINPGSGPPPSSSTSSWRSSISQFFRDGPPAPPPGASAGGLSNLNQPTQQTQKQQPQVPSQVPSKIPSQVPGKGAPAVRSSAVPSSAVPSSAVPSSAVPSSAVPSSAVPAPKASQARISAHDFIGSDTNRISNPGAAAAAALAPKASSPKPNLNQAKISAHEFVDLGPVSAEKWLGGGGNTETTKETKDAADVGGGAGGTQGMDEFLNNANQGGLGPLPKDSKESVHNAPLNLTSVTTSKTTSKDSQSAKSNVSSSWGQYTWSHDASVAGSVVGVSKESKSEVNGSKSGLNGLKSEVTGLKSELTGSKSGLNGLKIGFNGSKSKREIETNGSKSTISLSEPSDHESGHELTVNPLNGRFQITKVSVHNRAAPLNTNTTTNTATETVTSTSSASESDPMGKMMVGSAASLTAVHINRRAVSSENDPNRSGSVERIKHSEARKSPIVKETNNKPVGFAALAALRPMSTGTTWGVNLLDTSEAQGKHLHGNTEFGKRAAAKVETSESWSCSSLGRSSSSSGGSGASESKRSVVSSSSKESAASVVSETGKCRNSNADNINANGNGINADSGPDEELDKILDCGSDIGSDIWSTVETWSNSETGNSKGCNLNHKQVSIVECMNVSATGADLGLTVLGAKNASSGGHSGGSRGYGFKPYHFGISGYVLGGDSGGSSSSGDTKFTNTNCNMHTEPNVSTKPNISISPPLQRLASPKPHILTATNPHIITPKKEHSPSPVEVFNCENRSDKNDSPSPVDVFNWYFDSNDSMNENDAASSGRDADSVSPSSGISHRTANSEIMMLREAAHRGESPKSPSVKVLREAVHRGESPKSPSRWKVSAEAVHGHDGDEVDEDEVDEDEVNADKTAEKRDLRQLLLERQQNETWVNATLVLGDPGTPGSSSPDTKWETIPFIPDKMRRGNISSTLKECTSDMRKVESDSNNSRSCRDSGGVTSSGTPRDSGGTHGDATTCSNSDKTIDSKSQTRHSWNISATTNTSTSGNTSSTTPNKNANSESNRNSLTPACKNFLAALTGTGEIRRRDSLTGACKDFLATLAGKDEFKGNDSLNGQGSDVTHGAGDGVTVADESVNDNVVDEGVNDNVNGNDVNAGDGVGDDVRSNPDFSPSEPNRGPRNTAGEASTSRNFNLLDSPAKGFLAAITGRHDLTEESTCESIGRPFVSVSDDNHNRILGNADRFGNRFVLDETSESLIGTEDTASVANTATESDFRKEEGRERKPMFLGEDDHDDDVKNSFAQETLK